MANGSCPTRENVVTERIELPPLLGDGLVQGLDGLILIGDADFQRIDPRHAAIFR